MTIEEGQERLQAAIDALVARNFEIVVADAVHPLANSGRQSDTDRTIANLRLVSELYKQLATRWKVAADQQLDIARLWKDKYQSLVASVRTSTC